MSHEANKLLTEMQKATASTYISDMRSCDFNMQAKKKISDIPNDEFTVEEWNGAVSYVTNAMCNCKTVKEAKEELNKRK